MEIFFFIVLIGLIGSPVVWIDMIWDEIKDDRYNSYYSNSNESYRWNLME